VKLSFCNSCQSVSYCSRECQKADWKTHKIICKELNVGDARQVVHLDQLSRAKTAKVQARLALSECGTRARRFFDLFFETQGDTDHTDTVRKMKKIFLKESRYNRQDILFRSFSILSGLPSKMLKMPTSPLKVALQVVDASIMSCPGPNMDDGRGYTPLHYLAKMSDPSKEDTLENQCILAKQLIEAGANVNAHAQRNLGKITPLHNACSGGSCTNLAFIQLILDHGANPNAKDSYGLTPLHCTYPGAPGAAKFLLAYSNKTYRYCGKNVQSETSTQFPLGNSVLSGETVARSRKIVGRTRGFRQWMAGLRLWNQSHRRIYYVDNCSVYFC
jgi:hypothetical protein